MRRLTNVSIAENPQGVIYVYGEYGSGNNATTATLGHGKTKEEAIANAKSGGYKTDISVYESFYSQRIHDLPVGKTAKKGGRTTAAHNKDHDYVSGEDWEQRYKPERADKRPRYYQTEAQKERNAGKHKAGQYNEGGKLTDADIDIFSSEEHDSSGKNMGTVWGGWVGEQVFIPYVHKTKKSAQKAGERIVRQLNEGTFSGIKLSKGGKSGTTYTVTDIDYELEARESGEDLPETMEVFVPESIKESSDISDYIGDEISNKTGWAVEGFATEPSLFKKSNANEKNKSMKKEEGGAAVEETTEDAATVETASSSMQKDAADGQFADKTNSGGDFDHQISVNDLKMALGGKNPEYPFQEHNGKMYKKDFMKPTYSEVKTDEGVFFFGGSTKAGWHKEHKYQSKEKHEVAYAKRKKKRRKKYKKAKKE